MAVFGQTGRFWIVFEQTWLNLDKMVVFGQTWLSNLDKMVVFGQTWLYLDKWSFFDRHGSIWTKCRFWTDMALFGQNGRFWTDMTLFGQNGSYWRH